ncbi:hypothetical protein SAMN04488012_103373 [Palleronia salina]|uniref:Antifreeze protein n=1 Tax=Palleronia salina TaxID=313368 RepID=A0A1M6F8P3_9RHOB|nr:hypothetical protein [Palleronia salina]SHI94026.1 hypothetical protein SAMN04488012_103373 [Palleronia salina]
MTLPLDMWRSAMASAQMVAEAQAVIAYRLAGLAGVWSVAPTENAVMIGEKGPALLDAQAAAWTAAMRGGRPDQVYNAWLGPIGKATRANARRLGKRGLRQRA